MSRRLAQPIVALLAVAAFGDAARAQEAGVAKPELLGVQKIWDAAPHNAFTDLIRHDGRWLCAFRESGGHMVRDGKMRVIASDDGEKWESVAELVDPRGDLRDAKFAHTPDGGLTLLTATALKAGGHQSLVWSTRDGKLWDGPRDVGEFDVWLWGLKFRGDVGLSVGYSTGKPPRFTRVYRTADAKTFAPVAPDLAVPAPFKVSESAIAFADDGRAVMLLRCDPEGAFLATAPPPYEQWTLKQTATRVGGPALTRTPDGRWLGAGRMFDDPAKGKGPHTSLFWVDPESAAITECLRLPSGGDTSYPGLIWHEGTLFVSYYSTHEGKTSIYLARVKVPASR